MKEIYLKGQAGSEVISSKAQSDKGNTKQDDSQDWDLTEPLLEA